MDVDAGEVLTPREVALLIRVPEPTLRRWRSAGAGPAYLQLGGHTVRYRRGDVIAWLDAKRRDETSSDHGQSRATDPASASE